MSETKKPAIRFQGFSDEWKQSRVGELIEDYTEKTVVQNQYPVLTSSQQQGIVRQEEYFADRQVTTNDNVGYFVLPFGYFTYRSRSDTDVFVFNRNDLMNKGIISYYYPVFAPKSCDSNFLLRRLNYGIKKQLSMAAEGTGQKVLAHNKFKDMIVDVPDEKEQIKIGVIFEYIDNLIAQHQSKLEKLQAIKASMLEKMFPKDGADVPEVRFKGFTGAWERAKLENYLSVSNEKNTSDTYDKTDVLSVSGDYGIINQIEFQGRSFAGVSVSNYGVVHTGDVVYTKSPLNSNPYGIIKTNKGKPGIVSTLYAVYHTKKNAFPDFVQVYFEQHARMNNYMHPLVNKGAKNDMKVSAENALKGTVIFPNYREQEAISAFFAKFDHFIVLQQQELDKLQSIKKALLEKMFV